MAALNHKPQRVGRPQKINIDALHRHLFRKADRMGRLKLPINKLSEELGLGYCHLIGVVKKMADEGRLKRLSGTTYGTKTYVVRDPATWTEERARQNPQ